MVSPDFQTKTLGKLVKSLRAQRWSNLSATLRIQFVTANSACSGAQYHAEVTLHASRQNRGTVRQREVDA